MKLYAFLFQVRHHSKLSDSSNSGGLSSAELHWRPEELLRSAACCTVFWTLQTFQPILVLAYSHRLSLLHSRFLKKSALSARQSGILVESIPSFPTNQRNIFEREVKNFPLYLHPNQISIYCSMADSPHSFSRCENWFKIFW